MAQAPVNPDSRYDESWTTQDLWRLFNRHVDDVASSREIATGRDSGEVTPGDVEYAAEKLLHTNRVPRSLVKDVVLRAGHAWPFDD